jgi:hypothetical protein
MRRLINSKSDLDKKKKNQLDHDAVVCSNRKGTGDYVVDTDISGLTSGYEPDSLGAVDDGRFFLQFLVKFFDLVDNFSTGVV